MRLTDRVSALVDDAIADQAQAGETFHHEVMLTLAYVPGGMAAELAIVIVGYDAQDQPIMAPPVLISGTTTTAPVVDGHVEDALTYIRAQ